MTTIATDGVSIAADGQVTYNDRPLTLSENKLRELDDGSVVGWAGEADAAAAAVEYLAQHPYDRNGPEGNYSLLRLFPSGAIALYAGALRPAYISPPQAIGSGQDFALGAMLAGKSAKRAVQIAASLDIHTGGTIRSRKVRR